VLIGDVFFVGTFFPAGFRIAFTATFLPAVFAVTAFFAAAFVATAFFATTFLAVAFLPATFALPASDEPASATKNFGRMQLRNLLRQYKVPIQENPSIIPAVMCEVDPAGRGSEINFVLLYSRICSALLAPSALEGFGIPQEPNQPVELLRNSQLMFEAAIKGMSKHTLNVI
jgi:hypothetical protein